MSEILIGTGKKKDKQKKHWLKETQKPSHRIKLDGFLGKISKMQQLIKL